MSIVTTIALVIACIIITIGLAYLVDTNAKTQIDILFEKDIVKPGNIIIERYPDVSKNPFDPAPIVNYARVLDIKNGYVQYQKRNLRIDPTELTEEHFSNRDKISTTIGRFRKNYKQKVNYSRKDKLDSI